MQKQYLSTDLWNSAGKFTKNNVHYIQFRGNIQMEPRELIAFPFFAVINESPAVT